MSGLKFGKLDSFIDEAIAHVEMVDHLIGSPIEPFIGAVEFNGFNSPLLSCFVTTVEDLSDFFHCAERSGFTQTSPQFGRDHLLTKPNEKMVNIAFNKVTSNGIIQLWLFVEYEIIATYEIKHAVEG